MSTKTDTDTAEKITFRRREYIVTQNLPVTPLLANEGIVRQAVITGKHGATRLLQVWADGVLRTISTSGRVEEQLA